MCRMPFVVRETTLVLVAVVTISLTSLVSAQPTFSRGSDWQDSLVKSVTRSGPVDDDGQRFDRERLLRMVNDPRAVDQAIQKLESASHHDSRLIVRFRANMTAQTKTAVHRRVGITRRVRAFQSIADIEVVQVPKASLARALATYLADREFVEYAEPDYDIFPTDVPNDPFFELLWGMNNTGQDVTGPFCFSSGESAADIRAPKVWENWQGDPTFRIAVLDTGANLSHPDLIDNLWTNPGEIPDNGIDDDGNGWVDDVHGYDMFHGDGDPDDDNGHGTHVSGTIGAVGNNGIGVTGVNWRCKIVPLKIFSSGGSFGGSLSGTLEAMDYVIVNNIPVSNNSWRTDVFGFSLALFDMIEASQSIGHLFVAAAGNNGWDNDYFENYPSNYNLENIIAVLATDNRDNRATFSNYGLTRVDIGAPGACIYSTGLDEVQYFFNAGTSMASPHVAGVVALTWSKYPDLSWQQIRERVLFTARPSPALEGLIVTGGIIDAAAAVWDCNHNNIPDDDDIAANTSFDCNNNRLPDECEPDCNKNNQPDECDIASGVSDDCSGNGIPDECEPDCQSNGAADSCDIADGNSGNCLGLFGNLIPDECEPDCNDNGEADSCDLNQGTTDCNFNRIPDECEPGAGVDCNENGRDDICDLVFTTFFVDCNKNGLLDVCETRDNPAIDCNGNSTPDECTHLENDCNNNDIPDECDIADGTSTDKNQDGFPDECDISNLGVSFVPVSASGSHTIDPATNRIVLNGAGQLVTLELRVNGFDPNGDQSARLAAYEVGFSPANLAGPFGQISLYRPTCASNFDCPNWQSFCEIETELCNPLSAITYDETRKDYIFRDKLTLTTAAIEPDVRLGNVLLTQGDFVTDDGLAKYAGTLMIDVPEGIRGTFTVPFDPARVAFFGTGIVNLDVPVGLPFRITILEDCNGNGTPDHVDIENGASLDCGNDGVPDECEPDCDIDTIPDSCEPDCDADGIPDDCDDQTDCNQDDILDHCQDTSADCNTNDVWDACEITAGTSGDCNADGVPDECPFGPVFELSRLDGYQGVMINGINPLDQAGFGLAGNGDINGDGFNDIIIGAHFADHEELQNPGAVYVLFGSDRMERNPTIELSELSTVGDVRGFVIRGAAEGDLAGHSVAIAGDVNGDGYDDIIIGASEASPEGRAFAGTAYIVFGGPTVAQTGLVDLANLNAPVGITLNGLTIDDLTGFEVSAAGDINNDSFADIAIFAPNANNGAQVSAGAVYVIFGNADLSQKSSIDLASLDGSNGFVVRGQQADDFAGFSVVGVGDINNDGADDLAIGAPLADRGEMINLGFAYILFGQPTIGTGGQFDLASLDGTNGFTIRGEVELAQVGRSISSRGDFNGDGIDDLILSAPWTDISDVEIPGKIHVVYGHSRIGLSGKLSIQSAKSASGMVIDGQERLETIGRHVSIIGDINGDRIDDLAIGSPFSDPRGQNAAGKCYIVLGRRSPATERPLNVASLSGTNGFAIDGEDAADRLGWRVVPAGDMNGDGLDDLLVSVFAGDPDGRPNAGQVLLIFSRPQGLADCDTNDVWDLCDIASATADDCDDNRVPDVCQNTSTDCNENDEWDACDLRDVVSFDFNNNDIPDECDGCIQNQDCLDTNPCTYELCDAGQCSQFDIRYGDIAPPFQGLVEIADILCAVRGFGDYDLCPQADIAGCVPGGSPLMTSDIFALVEAFTGEDPCNCNNPSAASPVDRIMSADLKIEMKSRIDRDGSVKVEVFGQNASQVQAYQIAVVTNRDDLRLNEIVVDDSRHDFLFAGQENIHVADLSRNRVAVVSMNSPNPASRKSRYLATFVFKKSRTRGRATPITTRDFQLVAGQTQMMKSSRTQLTWKSIPERSRLDNADPDARISVR